MNWWFGHVFVDRITPVTSVASYDAKQHPEVQSAHGLWYSLGRVFHWLKAKYQESAQRRHEWRVYNSLNDHQLRDIGLSRDDVDLLLHGKKLVYPQQKPQQYKSSQVVRPGSLLRDTELEKPSPSSCSTVSGNDCGEKVA